MATAANVFRNVASVHKPIGRTLVDAIGKCATAMNAGWKSHAAATVIVAGQLQTPVQIAPPGL